MSEDSPLRNLAKYVQEHAIRGTCRCGKCADHPGEDSQPEGHTADVVFFQVANDGGTAEELKALVSAVKDGEFCSVDVFDGEEHGYIELGGWIGDQGLAMMLMGLGAVLGLWRLMTPKMLGLPNDLVMQMAGAGMITIQSR
jgi:hypothetical protein